MTLNIPLTLRLVKGEKLTWAEGDDNFKALRDAILSVNTGKGRQIVAGITQPLGLNQTALLDLEMSESCDLVSVGSDTDCWIRVYSTAAARLADAGRLYGTDPIPGHGIVGEVATYSPDYLTIYWSPVPFFTNNDNPSYFGVQTTSDFGDIPFSLIHFLNSSIVFILFIDAISCSSFLFLSTSIILCPTNFNISLSGSSNVSSSIRVSYSESDMIGFPNLYASFALIIFSINSSVILFLKIT